jgi:beta-N-acetylhexosaminidase
VSDLEQAAGDVLCVGLPSAVLDDVTRAALAGLRPGALVLFARNVTTLEATRALVAQARAVVGGDAPALVCVDQEGGRVLRLPFASTAMPAMLALGAVDDEVLAERAGRRLAADLRSVGANVDFAPVLDLAIDPENTVIGTRALGSDPARVGALGAALVRGLQAGGVAATVKHFPGHGATAVDSHIALPSVNADAATLRAREFVPFAAAFAAGARAVMTAHLVATAVDPERPATLSPRLLGDVLRGELGFAGVCFTDCLTMDAIARGVGSERGAVLALAAGADALTISDDLALATRVRDAVVAAVRAGELPRARLDEAAERVRALRRAFAESSVPTDAAPDGDVAAEIARRALAVVRGRAALDPTLPATIVSFEGDTSDGVARVSAARPSLALALRRRRVRAELLRVPLAPSDDERDALLAVLDAGAALGPRSLVVIARRAHLHAAQRVALDAVLRRAPNALAISALEPFDVPALAAAATVVSTYGDGESHVEALADRLVGRA